MADKDRGLNRGGAGGQEGEFETPDMDKNHAGDEQAKLERDHEKQRGGISREPNLEKQPPQPKHVVD